MKIAFFTPTLKVGGYERVVMTYANALAQMEGNEVTLLCGESSGELKDQVAGCVKIVDLHCRTRTLLFRLVSYFRQEQPDCFYVGFRIYNSIAVLAKLLAGNRKTKIFISQHGFEYQSKLQKRIHRIMQKRAAGFIAVTDSLKDFEQNSLHLSCPACVIGNPVVSPEMTITRIKDAWFDDGLPVICVCGRLSEDKNVGLAVDVLRQLHSMSVPAKLLILGEGPEKTALEKKVESCGLENDVRFVGFVHNPMEYMKACTVYLHTCDREGFGNAVVEAMFAGLPVVTTDCGGPVDIIEKDKYGICFGGGRVASAAQAGAQAIARILKGECSFEGLREKALQYTVEASSQKLMGFFVGGEKDDSQKNTGSCTVAG